MVTILSGIQGLVNLLFFVAIVGTIGVSWLYAYRLRDRHNADFPWGKALAIIGIEVLTMIAFNIFFEIFKANWLWISIVGVVVIFIILKRKKRKYV
ncbi:MAG: hypothetical protein OXU23_04185 [Candidatus Poribacteria bacterium]|nr:hypothetical protein [Candidatus Poribacteria bacterium]